MRVEDTTRLAAREGEAARLLLTSLLNQQAHIVGFTDERGRMTYMSPSVREVMGYTPEELMGVDGFDFIHPEDQEVVRERFAEVLAAPGIHPPLEVRARHADGTWRWFELIQTNLLHVSVGSVVHQMRDIGARKETEEELVHRALHDPLTGLPNRALANDRLQVSLAATRRTGRPTAVLFLDLDHFKEINDRLGHRAGDRLLVAAADRLREVVRPQDTVARHGGDEFVLVCTDLIDLLDSTWIAERIVTAFGQPFEIDAGDVYISTSVGIALSEDGTEEPERLMADADAAVYMAKARGGACAAVFDPGVRDSSSARLDLARSLHGAVDRGEFLLHFQPITEIASGRVTKIEALLRWQHPERGLLTPDEFLAIAEDTGQIVPIGLHSLEMACAEAARWVRECIDDPAPSIAVNVSQRQLAHHNFVDAVQRTLHVSGLPAASLQLEVTDSAKLTDPMIEALRELRARGVVLAIDDFGIGLSSLGRLRKLDVDVLKVDDTFVRGMIDRPVDRGIVAAVIDLAHSLGLTVTAEGVETTEQIRTLRELGCDHAQGYLFGAPAPADGLFQPS